MRLKNKLQGDSRNQSNTGDFFFQEIQKEMDIKITDTDITLPSGNRLALTRSRRSRQTGNSGLCGNRQS